MSEQLLQLESQLLKYIGTKSLTNPVKLTRLVTKKYLLLGIEYTGLPSAVDYIRIRISKKTGRFQAEFTMQQFDGAKRMVKMVRSRWFSNRKIFIRKLRRYLLSDSDDDKLFRFLFERNVKQ